MSRALTIGNFDGVHLGHMRVIKRICQLGSPTLYTFSNHPSEVLQSSSKKLLVLPEHKIWLLQSLGIETLVEPFTTQLSQLTAEQFLSRFEFDHLVLGHDAVIGKNRSGDYEELTRLSQKMGFTLEYVDPALHNDKPISSSRIRDHIEKGELESASTLLGRAYTIRGKVIEGSKRNLGFATANIDVSGLCLPPLGVYRVRVGELCGLANLGVAPTFGPQPPKLEVHLLDFSGDLYGQTIEVELEDFIRKERSFSSREELIAQIQEDLALPR
ncbi:MAG: Bifunctional riboflavin kinase/FMN adenylyltransferase [Chlamydiales bacterium]|nr:Bifunctional riboflavin kinase/FMN adenylyltransferase [Chlamydiales bacterium]